MEQKYQKTGRKNREATNGEDLTDTLAEEKSTFTCCTSSSSAATGNKSTGSAPTASGPDRPVRFEVRHLRLIRGKVTVGVGNTALTLPMPELEMRDLGTREGGINAAQLATAVLTDVTRNIVSATLQAAGKIGATGGAGAVEDLKKAGDSLKKLIGR